MLEILERLDTFRKKLIDLTARNSLLSSKLTPTSSLRFVDELPDQVFNYIIEGPNFTVIKDVESLTRDMIRKNKPIGAICIAPVMIAKILQNMNRGGKVTGGFDEKISADIESMGINIKKVDARNIVVDNKNKIVSTPAYVEAKSIKDVAIGIDKLVNKVLEMV